MTKTSRNLFIMLMLSLLILSVLRYYYWKRQNLIYIEGGGDKQLVANLPNKHQSAELLAEIKRRLVKLINYCIETEPDNRSVKILKSRFKSDNVQETSENDSGTSYTIDKGEELHLCLRDKETRQLHDINILMFVSIHELAHVMSSSYGHNEEFARNFVFLLKKASQCGVYVPENYSKNEKNFCGIKVNSNPLF